MRHIVREEVKRGKIVLVSSSGFAEMDNFDPLVSHVKALSRNLGRDYAGEVLVPSAWYYQYDEQVLEEAFWFIESAGEELVVNGKIPCDISVKIGALVSREKVVKALNSVYVKYE